MAHTSTVSLSDIAEAMPASPIRKLVPYAQNAKNKGVHVYHLNIGDPDIKTPEVMVDVLSQWAQNPIGYSQSKGEPQLTKSLLAYYHGLGFTNITEDDIQITFGGSEGILWSILSVCNPGDELIVFDPTYANYISLATMAGVRVVPILTKIEDGFHLPDRARIEKAITSKTRGFLFSNPGNPTGVVLRKDEMDMLVDLAQQNNLYVLADEVYREFVYDKSVRVVSCLEYANRYPQGIVLLDSLSKRYSLCGARVGAVVSKNSRFMESLLRYAQARLSAGLIDQLVAAKLTHVTKQYFDDVITEYRARRDTIVSGLKAIDGVTLYTPEGAFYVIAKLPVKNAEDFAQWLLTDFSDNNETVMVAPAAGFYATPGRGADEVRIAYVLHVDSLKRSAELISKALQIYKAQVD